MSTSLMEMKPILMLPSARRYVQGALCTINWDTTENFGYLPRFLTATILYCIETLSEWQRKCRRLTRKS